MKSITWKIRSSQRVLKSALNKFSPKVAIAWTGGKDSTVLLHMVRSLQNNQIQIPAIFIDHGLHFDETYEFVNKIEKEWKLNLIKVTDKGALRKYHQTKSRIKKKELSRKMKINAVKKAIKKNKWRALIVGIRWDEHEARSSEVYFSMRKDHMRIHPILHFTEKNIWNYINEFKLPYNPLYDSGYRSIGEKPFTKPVEDPNKSERSGREKEKEKIMERLRTLGYF